MQPICLGAQGAAVEDIQQKLTSLSYQIDAEELDTKNFGPSTADAVAHFRADMYIKPGNEVDEETWSALVDESYIIGNRTLYLRLPNFHGRDVRELQTRLNILGFSCGKTDGYYGAHTEAAVKQFQENVGLLPDGMAFPDTFDAIERLRHVWSGTQANGPHPTNGMGFARAARVLERSPLALSADDPISRNIVGRIWNLASATTPDNKLMLLDDPKEKVNCPMIILTTTPLGRDGGMANVVVDSFDTFAQRIRTAYESSTDKYPTVRLELPCSSTYDGTFTTSDAQTFAVLLLDAFCTAFDD